MLVLLSTVTHSVLPDYTDLASLPISMNNYGLRDSVGMMCSHSLRRPDRHALTHL